MGLKTVTISINRIWQPSEEEILSGLRAMLPRMPIQSVDRALFSGRYVVQFHNTENASDQTLSGLFILALQSMGYEGEVISIEGGGVSSAPGGILQAVTETAQASSSFMIPLAVVAVAALVILYLPRPK